MLWGKNRGSEKTSTHQESDLGHIASDALPLSYDIWATTVYFQCEASNSLFFFFSKKEQIDTVDGSAWRNDILMNKYKLWIVCAMEGSI